MGVDIFSEQGRAALSAASVEADPGSLGAAGRLRKSFPPELAAQALSQVALRRKAVKKFSRADEMFFTPAGLEQATRQQVSTWRAQQFRDAGVTEVLDLGCGIGADSMAFLAGGLTVHAVEADADTAAIATANLALLDGPTVQVANAEDIDVPAGAGIFMDPARRTNRGRTWRVEDFSPPWSLVLEHLRGPHVTAIKMGPGLPKDLIPGGVRATWVSHRGDVVETSLWNGPGPLRSAVVFPRDGSDPLELSAEHSRELMVLPPGRFIIEPDNAVIRSGLVTDIAPAHDLWLLHEQIAYLSSDVALVTPLADCFEVETLLPFEARAIRAHVKSAGIGTLEIKCRGLDVDPAALRRQLRPHGPRTATLILLRTASGTQAAVTHRVAGGVVA